MDRVLLAVNGVPFHNFTKISVSRSIENFCGTFDFEATAADQRGFPIGRGAHIGVMVNGRRIVTGWVEKISPSISSSDHMVSISGRDVTCDLVDSTLAANSVELNPPITLEGIIQAVLDAIGLKLTIKNNVAGLEPFGSDDLVACEAGQGAFEFIELHARKKQVLITTDGNGTIVITRAETVNGDYRFTNRRDGAFNNVLSSSASYDDSQRFNQYVVQSQGNMVGANKSGAANFDDLVNVTSNAAVDSEVRRGRVLHLVAEQSALSGTAYDRAVWEASVRKARSMTYSATLDGITDDNGAAFEFNRVVMVDDDAAGINALMLVKSVSFSIDSSGSETSFEMAERGAYTLELNQPKAQKRVNKIGKYFNDDLETTEQLGSSNEK